MTKITQYFKKTFFLTLLGLAIGIFLTNFLKPARSYINTNHKKIIINYVYRVINDYFAQNQRPMDPLSAEILPSFTYEKVFVSLYHKNKLRGCQSGSAKLKSSNRLAIDLKQATIKALNDSRFGDKLQKKESGDIIIVLNFLSNKKLLAKNNYNYFKKNIELGIHSISLLNKNNGAYFISSVPVTKNFRHKEMLEKLCNKTSLDEYCYLDENTKIFAYDTAVFMGYRNKFIADLYRFNILIKTENITGKNILENLVLTERWLKNSINPDTGLLEYIYFPSKNRYAQDNNHTRQLATLWATTKLKLFIKTSSLDDLITRTLDYYLKNIQTRNGYTFIKIGQKADLSFNAFTILALLNSNYSEKDEVMKQLALGILAMQKQDGSYYTNFESKKISGINYFPGEAMLALMYLYDYTKNNLYLDSVKKASRYYRVYWVKNKNTAFIPWHTQVYFLLFKETKDISLIKFIFEMNDWLINNYQIQTSKYPDEIGGFPKKNPGGCMTAVYLEGLNDAYSLANYLNDAFHKNKYTKAIRLGTRFVMQNQFNLTNSFYFKNPNKAIGGIKKRIVDNELRIDNVQHTIMALIKTYENKLF